jgi:hypothetical protein
MIHPAQKGCWGPCGQPRGCFSMQHKTDLIIINSLCCKLSHSHSTSDKCINTWQTPFRCTISRTVIFTQWVAPNASPALPWGLEAVNLPLNDSRIQSYSFKFSVVSEMKQRISAAHRIRTMFIR